MGSNGKLVRTTAQEPMTNKRQMAPVSQPYEIANWIMMGNNQKAKAALIVEGESDTSVFLFLADIDRCRLFIAKGKNNVLEAIAITQKARYKGVAAVVDADFWHLERLQPTLPSVFVTDTHDLETMMLRTRAYEKLLFFYELTSLGTVEIKPDAFVVWAANLLREIQGDAMTLGYLRWASSRHNLRIKFKEVPIRRCLDNKNSRLHEERVETEILRASDKSAGTWNEIRAKAFELEGQAHDPWQVCSGHDLTEILSHYLERVLGRRVDRKEVEKQLALCYDSSDFFNTELCRRLSAWEQTEGRQLLRRLQS